MAERGGRGEGGGGVPTGQEFCLFVDREEYGSWHNENPVETPLKARGTILSSRSMGLH